MKKSIEVTTSLGLEDSCDLQKLIFDNSLAVTQGGRGAEAPTFQSGGGPSPPSLAPPVCNKFVGVV